MPAEYVFALYRSDDLEHIDEPEDIAVLPGASKVLAQEIFLSNGWAPEECEFDNIGLLQVVNR